MSEDLLKEPLPEPWTFGVTNDGRVFFINDEEKRTTWLHPDTGKPVRSGLRSRPDLPKGWEEGFTETGGSYYVNHNKGLTTFSFPDNADEKSKVQKRPKVKSNDHLYQNISTEAINQEKKKRRNSSFLERSGINIFRRSSSKAREKPEQIVKQPSKRVKEKKEKHREKKEKHREKKQKPEKKTKSARPTSATSIRSTQSKGSMRSKMMASWRDPKQNVIKSGWLYKQDSTGKMKMWRKKWFVLADFCLYYYKDSKEDEILGNIILPSYTVSTMTAEDKISRKYAFKVEHTGMKTYYLSADSYNDMAQWITALRKSCCLSPRKDQETSTEPVSDKESDTSDEIDSKGTEVTKNKKRDSSESRKKKTVEDDDSEFGFNHVNVRPASSTTSSQSAKHEQPSNKSSPSANLSSNNNKYDPNVHHRNGRIPADSRQSSQGQKQLSGQAHGPRKVQDSYQQRSVPNAGTARSPSGRKDPQHSAKDGRQHRPTHRQDQNVPPMRQGPHPQHKNVRRENGESAYFSDTSGATDSSRFANSSDRGNVQHRQQNGQQHAPPQEKSKVKRQNSLVKLGDWVINQKMRQSGGNLNSPQRSNFDTASEFSSVSQQHTRKSATMSARGQPQQRMGPPSSRRYRARTYNEYMDPMEVASSTISMPPLQHMNANRMNNRAKTMPRPQSAERVDKMGRPLRMPDSGQRMMSSKSAGNVMLDQYGNPVSPQQRQHSGNTSAIKKAKSEYVIQDDDFQRQYIANFKIAQSRENQVFLAPRQQRRSQQRPQSAGRASTNSSSGGTTPRRSQNPPKSAGTPNDVFTPRSDASSARSNRDQQQVFQFDTSNNKHYLSPSYNGVPRPTTLTPGSRQPDTGVEVKQIQKGQLRAFCLSAKSPPAQLPPPERQTPLKSTENLSRMPHSVANDRDVETKLKRLNDCERGFQQISDDVTNLLSEKERLEAELSIAKFKVRNRHSTGEKTQLDMEQHKLEQELGNVNAQLANSVQKLKEMAQQNDNFNYEIKRLKANILEEIKKQRPITDDVYDNVSNQNKENKRRLEWELGRVEFIIEGLNKQKSDIIDKLRSIDLNKGDDSPLLSPKTPPTSILSANTRSPRDVKRTSMERRTTPNRPSYSSTSSSGTPNSTPVKKYFTLPGRGVTHATSVDSMTAESLAKQSPRPTSARSVSSIGSSNLSNLHRTRSAAERLFQAPYSNQSYDYEAKEMKRLQKEITRNRRNNLKSGSVGDMPGGMTLPARSHMKVGIDVQMALKHHRMPKVLQRAKRDMARAEQDRMNHQIELDIDDLERQVNPKSSGLYGYSYDQVRETIDSARQLETHPVHDNDDNEITVDVNLTHQLITPGKVEIPERYVEYEDIELSPAEEKMKYKKMAAIERILAKSGQQASLPAVHLAAALAVEAGSVARAVAMHASVPQRHPGDGQKEQPLVGRERPVTDGSSSAGEDLEVEMGSSLLQQDPEYTAAYIV
uniref:uncharacterized protein LOC120345514 isoform X2 n=1 Tax=Styela clava TaxID=7725 RepID=UPI00193A9E7D|nr:uncharacterized protein LOC120345514 isoform X2 [Styela clava]